MLIKPAPGDKDDRTGLKNRKRDTGKLAQSAVGRIESINARQASNIHLDHTLPDLRVLTALLMHLPGMAYRCRYDEDRTMEFVSEGCFHLTGYRSAELILNQKVSYWQLIHHEDREPVRQNVDLSLKRQNAYDLIYCIVTKTGEKKWVRDQGRGVFMQDGDPLALEGFISDITDKKWSESRLKRQVQRFSALRKIDNAITGSSDLRVTMNVLIDQVITHLNVDAADVLLYDPKTQLLEYVVGRGFQTAIPKQVRLPLGMSLAGVALREHQTVQIADLPSSLKELGRIPHNHEASFQSYMAVPLITKGLTKGILEIFFRSELHSDEEWFEFLEALAGQAAIAIENSTLYNELQRSNRELSIAYDATLEGWSKALELRDQGTDGHTQRVTDMTLQLAKVVGFPNTEMHHLRRGVLLHDIGKMGIPDRILLKPGPLSPEEWEIMRQHPVYAFQLLSPIPDIANSLDIPYCHHERWDGTGYPRGLKGEQIPLAARIFAVVDVWDALLSNRPYRPAWPRENAVSYIYQQKGTIFQPEIVDAFLEMMGENGRG